MINLNDLTNDRVPQNSYQEDTSLEDRLALEAEEDKKIGSQYPDDSDYAFSRSSLSGRDVTQVLLYRRLLYGMVYCFLPMPPKCKNSLISLKRRTILGHLTKYRKADCCWSDRCTPTSFGF